MSGAMLGVVLCTSDLVHGLLGTRLVRIRVSLTDNKLAMRMPFQAWNIRRLTEQCCREYQYLSP